ncbi:MAG TPA: DUF6660 family protein [Sphingobacteriaceae bacterium]|nr:DUF6660 family protein [Sphingobacteriaceae bacterium]
MKILTILLSIYVMLLTGVSCPDEMEFSKDQYSTVQTHTTDQGHCPGDVCSPFCSCACSVAFTKVSTVKIQRITHEPGALNSYYQQKAYSSETCPPFLPPRA